MDGMKTRFASSVLHPSTLLGDAQQCGKSLFIIARDFLIGRLVIQTLTGSASSACSDSTTSHNNALGVLFAGGAVTNLQNLWTTGKQIRSAASSAASPGRGNQTIATCQCRCAKPCRPRESRHGPLSWCAGQRKLMLGNQGGKTTRLTAQNAWSFQHESFAVAAFAVEVQVRVAVSVPRKCCTE